MELLLYDCAFDKCVRQLWQFCTTVVSVDKFAKFIFMTARGRPQLALHVQVHFIIINIYFLLQ